MASEKSNLLRKVDFLLKSGFQDIVFFIRLEVGYLVIIFVNFVYKWAQNYFRDIIKECLIGLYFRNIFLIDGHVALPLFKVGHQNDCYQILKQ